MDPKGKGMVVNDKEKESIFNEPERELGLHLFPKLILVVELPNTNNWTN
jgi:hypothetical protein